ncbi:MAG: hypothetical protein ACR2PA_17110, partial [Hyphomicrobiaceae bacterium]
MLLRAASDTRPYHLGPFPMEVLPRDERVRRQEAERTASPMDKQEAAPQSEFAIAVQRYQALFDSLADGAPAAAKAPVPDDLARRSVDIKGGGYFLNAAQIGICRMPASAWLAAAPSQDQTFAIVVAVEHGRPPEDDNPAATWTEGCGPMAADMRAGEIACCLAGYVRQLGFAATAHSASQTAVDFGCLAVLAGVAVRREDKLVHPFLEQRYSLAAVTTEYALDEDAPLAEDADGVNGLHYWLGINGAES